MERTITPPGRQQTLRRTIQLGAPQPMALGVRGAPEPAEAPRLRLAQGLLLAAIVVAALLTLVLVAAPQLRWAYRNPRLQVEIDAVSAMVALLVSLLALGHFRRTLLRADLLLAAGLGLLGIANLILALALGLDSQDPSAFAVWLPDGTRLAAAGVLAASAWTPPAHVRRPDEAISRMLVFSLAVVTIIAGVLALLRHSLPDPVLAGPSPARLPMGSGPAGELVMQALLLLTYSVAAAGLLRRRRTLELNSAAIAAAVSLLAFAWLNFLLFSPIYSPWIQSGDVLWLAACLVLLGWAASAIRMDQREVARLALLNERGRVARELHDGLAQELVYLLGQARRMRKALPGTDSEHLVAASERALDETRAVISAFRAPIDEPLDAALIRLTGELERRLGIEIELCLARGVQVPADVREAVMRIVGEALTNAARHGGAERASVELREGDHLRVLVRDAGSGFDANRARRGGSFGLLVMRERAEAIGSKLDVRSSPDAGTEVEVVIP